MASSQESVDEIRRQMADLRSELHYDMSMVVDQAATVVDWRSYIKERPWISLGAACALGYVLVPRRDRTPALNSIVSAPAPLLAQAAPQKPAASLGWRAVRTVAGLLAPIAMRAAQGYAVRLVEGFIADHPPGPEFAKAPSEPTQHFDPRSQERFGFPRRG